MTQTDSRQGVEKPNIRKSQILSKKDNDPVKGLPKYKTHTRQKREREREREGVTAYILNITRTTSTTFADKRNERRREK